jgi:hypothetical protein
VSARLPLNKVIDVVMEANVGVDTGGRGKRRDRRHRTPDR